MVRGWEAMRRGCWMGAGAAAGRRCATLGGGDAHSAAQHSGVGASVTSRCSATASAPLLLLSSLRLRWLPQHGEREKERAQRTADTQRGGRCDTLCRLRGGRLRTPPPLLPSPLPPCQRRPTTGGGGSRAEKERREQRQRRERPPRVPRASSLFPPVACARAGGRTEQSRERRAEATADRERRAEQTAHRCEQRDSAEGVASFVRPDRVAFQQRAEPLQSRAAQSSAAASRRSQHPRRPEAEEAEQRQHTAHTAARHDDRSCDLHARGRRANHRTTTSQLQRQHAMFTTSARRMQLRGRAAHAAAAAAARNTSEGGTATRKQTRTAAAFHSGAAQHVGHATPTTITRVAKPKPFVPASSAAAAVAATPASVSAPFVPVFPPMLTPRARLAHGSSLDPATLLSLFQSARTPDASSPAGAPGASPPADLLLTDPPYLILHPRGGGGSERGADREATSRKKLRWDLTGATLSSPLLRFPNAATYTTFTISWMRLATDPRVLRPSAPWVVWTNYLGIKPIRDAVATLAPGRKLWAQMLWIKPAKPAASTKENKAALRVQHSIQPVVTDPSPSSTAAAVTPVAAPWTHFPPPPLSLPLTCNELAFRAYEVALVFGEGRWEESEYGASVAASSASATAAAAAANSAAVASTPDRYIYPRLDGSVVCPYEEDLLSMSQGAPASDSLLRHPNAKPLRVLLPLLHSFSAPDDLVLDPFLGSGSTGVVALASGRCIAGAEVTDVWARYARDQFERNLRKYLP